MSNKKLAIILLTIAIILAGGFAVWKLVIDKPAEQNTQPTTVTQPEAAPEVEDTSTSGEVSYARAEVATHSTKDSCWTIINGTVYDITSYIRSHPGGDRILQACGVDGTTLFTERTTNDGQAVGSGTPHSSSATQQLAQYKIGTLTN